MTYRVLFCGGREWTAPGPIRLKLEGILERHPDVELVHGAGRGADLVAAAAAEDLGIPCHAFPADWDNEGRAAGPLRNRRMLDFGIDAVYAFKRGFDRTMRRGGTEDMVRIALEAGIPTQVCEEDHTASVTLPTAARVHLTIAANTDGHSTKCGLGSQHHSTCSGFQSAVTCPDCKELM